MERLLNMSSARSIPFMLICCADMLQRASRYCKNCNFDLLQAEITTVVRIAVYLTNARSATDLS